MHLQGVCVYLLTHVLDIINHDFSWIFFPPFWGRDGMRKEGGGNFWKKQHDVEEVRKPEC